jgi:benzoyl-CoA reductase/2-hydroxyglutaryl-CoA dehydratase subunit BcrC/BadD/HgdB
VRLGGKSPSVAELAEVMLRFDRARAEMLRSRDHWSARQFAEAVVAVREGVEAVERFPRRSTGGVPLALVGGPLLEQDFDLLDWLEAAGGRIVLDATEAGERTLPRPLHPARMRKEAVEELVDAYFGSIPDVFRRPNDPCFEYLGREMAARQVRGIVFRRYLWCDLWHAELPRLKAFSTVPVLDLDAAQSEGNAEGRTRGRIEAFFEMLDATETQHVAVGNALRGVPEGGRAAPHPGQGTPQRAFPTDPEPRTLNPASGP